MNIKKIFDGVVDIIYPPRCPICEKIVLHDRACKECKKRLPYVLEPRCLKCGKHIENDTAEYCGDCTRLSHIFDSGMALFEYDDAVKQSMYRFKYKNKREYAAFYAGEIAKRYGAHIARLNIETIIPVPMYERKKRIRGYNQAEIVAEKLSEILKIPVDSTYLIRSKNTVPQKELTDKQRANNVKNAFQISKNSVKYNKVLLVDDIYTTGITMDECARVLKLTGCDKVYFVTVCVGRGF